MSLRCCIFEVLEYRAPGRGVNGCRESEAEIRLIVAIGTVAAFMRIEPVHVRIELLSHRRAIETLRRQMIAIPSIRWLDTNAAKVTNRADRQISTASLLPSHESQCTPAITGRRVTICPMDAVWHRK
jgi:hypothetical protein